MPNSQSIKISQLFNAYTTGINILFKLAINSDFDTKYNTSYLDTEIYCLLRLCVTYVTIASFINNEGIILKFDMMRQEFYSITPTVLLFLPRGPIEQPPSCYTVFVRKTGDERGNGLDSLLRLFVTYVVITSLVNNNSKIFK